MLVRLAVRRAFFSLSCPRPTFTAGPGLLAVALTSLGSVAAQSQVKLTASDAAAGDEFGASVAFENGRIAVGAPLDDNAAGVDAGSVYSFAPSGSGWIEDARLWTPAITPGAEFGRTLAFDGDTLAVGAWRDGVPASPRTGSVWIYTRSGSAWQGPRRLTASDARAGDEFGASIALRGDWMAVGAPSRPYGVVYVFRRQLGTWLLSQKLSAPGWSVPLEGFGWDVAFDGTNALGALLIGAPHRGVTFNLNGIPTLIPNAGAVYLYRSTGTFWFGANYLAATRLGWSSGGLLGLHFGRGIAAGDHQVVIEDDLYSIAYFRADGSPNLSYQRTLVGGGTPDPAPYPLESAAISSRMIAVGHRRALAFRGRVDRFDRAGSSSPTVNLAWFAQDGLPQDRFGSAVDLYGKSVVIGAPGDDHAGGIDAGSAYVFPDSCSPATWSVAHPGGAGAPPARSQHALASDDGRRRVVLFGGTSMASSGIQLGDTWEWNGSNWTQRFPLTPPGPRADFSLVYAKSTSYSSRVLLLGGLTNGGGPADLLWQWDGTNWSQVTSTGPAPWNLFVGNVIARHRAVWDTQRECMVAYGGSHQMPFTDTWEWRRSGPTTGAWTQLNTTSAANPGLRIGHAMAYDPVRRRTILHGGLTSVAGNNVVVGDTWSWDGQHWTLLTTTGTGALEKHVMEFDRVEGRLVLTAGMSQPGNTPNPLTWTWSGTQWTSVPASTTGPTEARLHSAMAWDAIGAELVLFGGAEVSGTGRSDTRTWCGSED